MSSHSSQKDISITNGAISANSSGSQFKLDESGRIAKIVYADGRARKFTRDRYGTVLAVTTIDSAGQRTFKNEGGQWYTDVDGMKLPLPGAIVVNPEGDVSMEVSGDGLWRIDRADGTQSFERMLVNGSKIVFDASLKVVLIVRADGSSIGRHLDGQRLCFKETTAGGDETIWTQGEDNLFRAAQDPSVARVNLALQENGSTTYSDSEGDLYTVCGNGVEFVEGPGRPKFAFDAQGRLESIEYGDGKKIRSFGYIDGSCRLNRITIVDRTTDSTKVYQRQGDAQFWTIRSADGRKLGEWRGDAVIRPSGIYSLQMARTQEVSGEMHWRSFRTDGSEVRELTSGNGARATFDTNGQLLSIERVDGSTVTTTIVNGQLIQVNEKDGTGSELVWTRQSDKSWACEQSTNSKNTARRSFHFNKHGETIFFDDDGNKHTIKLTGWTVVQKKDGSTVDVDRHGVVQRVSTIYGDWRSFDWVDDKLIRVQDTAATGEIAIWEHHPECRKRTNVSVSPDGDWSYCNEDGSATVERTTFQRLLLSPMGELVEVVNPDGSLRRFTYENGRLALVVDTNAAGRQTWEFEPGSNSFVHTDAVARRRCLNLMVCRDGDLQFTLENGRQEVARSIALCRESRQQAGKAQAGATPGGREAGSPPLAD